MLFLGSARANNWLYHLKSLIQWNLYKADTIRSKKKCPLYGDVHFIECFSETQSFSKYKDNTNIDAVK